MDVATPILAADLGDVLEIAVGVVLALCGAAVALMGAIAVTEGVVRRGLGALLVGAALCLFGLWRIGLLG